MKRKVIFSFFLPCERDSKTLSVILEILEGRYHLKDANSETEKEKKIVVLKLNLL